MSETVDWFALIAKTRGVPDGWLWNSSRVVDDGFLVSGAVCTATYQRGPRQGRLNWSRRYRDTEREIFIPRAELMAFKEQWERESGKCYECHGSAEVFGSWSAVDGTKTRPCARCNATGTAPQEAP